MLKSILSTLVFMFLMACGSAQEHEGITRINVDKQIEMTAQKDVVVIDVRTPEEVSEGYIKGAKQFIDYNADGFKEKIEALDKEKTYIVYCRSGGRSTRALNLMAELGFQNLYELEGGITSVSKPEYIVK